MSENPQTDGTTLPENDWTIIFFFAADNALSPLLISQLKAIKDAGFQENSKVIVYFDSQEQGVSTKVYNVNRKRKEHAQNDKDPRNSQIGTGSDSFVRDMEDDEILLSEINEANGHWTRLTKQMLASDDTTDAKTALENFLGFCHESHPAKHYIVVLFGHGMIVGNDAFLPDEHPHSGIRLTDLGDIVRDFRGAVGNAFELLALHSCSMSSIEVAYQLKNTAKYLMASQGLSFVGSWPYRNLLINAFNIVEKKEIPREVAGDSKTTAAMQLGVAELIRNLYWLTYFNARDFTRAGYSADLALCNLASSHFDELTPLMKTLVSSLKQGMGAPWKNEPGEPWENDPEGDRIRDLILLAHWESQSYWEESYTDLFDFCLCLERRCNDAGREGIIKAACSALMEKLQDADFEDRSMSRFVVYAKNFGWKYQYSRGLSVYFPWSEPVGNAETDILAKYGDYEFSRALGNDSWLSFLKDYFIRTRRHSRKFEKKYPLGFGTVIDGTEREAWLDDIRVTQVDKAEEENFAVRFNWFGALDDKPVGSAGPKPIPSAGPKPVPSSGVDDCSCPSIKNYSMIEIRRNKKRLRVKKVTITGKSPDPTTVGGKNKKRPPVKKVTVAKKTKSTKKR